MILPAAIASSRQWPRVRLHARDPRFRLAPLAFIVAVCLWLVPMAIAALNHPDPAYRAYLDDILFRQTAERYSKSWDHHQPVWYHLGVVLTLWLPTMFALIWAFPAWWRRLRRRDARYLLPLAWWAMILVFFSIPDGKRDVYIMPALPMVCLALAPLLPGIVRKLWARRIAFGFEFGLGSLLLFAGSAMWFGEPRFEARMVENRGLLDGGRGLNFLLLALGAWLVAAALRHRVAQGVKGLPWGLGGAWVRYSLIAHPMLNASGSSRGLMEAVGRRPAPEAELGLVAWKVQNLLMADRPAATFGWDTPWSEQLTQAMRWQADAPGRRWLLVQECALSQCIDKTKAEFAGLSNRRRWWLVPVHAADVDCVPQGVQSQNEADRIDGH